MTPLIEYDDTDKRDKRLDFWTAEDTRHNSTLNRIEGRSTLAWIRRQVAAEWARREAAFKAQRGRFQKGETMALHLMTLRRTVTIEQRGLEDMTRRRECWTDPDTVRACVVTRLA